MSRLGPWAAAAALLWLVAGCSSSLPEPVRQASEQGRLDLRSWNFQVRGAVIPQGWLWDPDTLWSPSDGGRPADLPPSLELGPPDHGGWFARVLGHGPSGPPVAATARMTILVDPRQSYDLQIGAFPGAYRVWVNGAIVRESGVVTADPHRFHAEGSGAIVTVQPRDGVLDIVAELVTNDPLVRHSELNRHWVIGPAESLSDSDRLEANWRSLQATILLIGLVVFFWMSRIRRERQALFVFVLFLGVCLLKLLANVEQPEPLLSPVWNGLPLSAYLYLNHGLNLWPFPFFVLFLQRQFPSDVSFRAFVVLTVVTTVATVWELLPFVALTLGWGSVYEAVMGPGWSFVLNLYVVAVTLFLFERFYQLYARRRPLSGAMFFGGMFLGLIILIPIPLSFFMPVKHIYFLGWGMFLYLSALCFDLIRLQIRASQAENLKLKAEVEQGKFLARMISPDWVRWLGRPSLEALQAGDRRVTEAILVQLAAAGDPSDWIALVGTVAASRQALLVDYRDGRATWALEAWSETALAFALDAQRRLLGTGLTDLRVVLARSTVEVRLFDVGPLWFPVVTGLPFARLEGLAERAARLGATLVLDSALQDGLVIGGWRRHRHLTVAGTEIELYEAEQEELALLKDQTLDSFEQALALAREGRWDDAVQALFAVVRHNPFDQAAKTLLTEWGSPRSP